MIMRTLTLIAAGAAMAGCTVSSSSDQTVGEQLGISVGSPDEFLVVSRRPLQRPPSFDLPRPQPGAPSRVEPDPFIDAHNAVFSRPEPVRLASATAGEQALLRGAGAEGDNSGVRAQLEAEDPNSGERQYGLTTIFGQPVPATLNNPDEIVEGPEEIEDLRARGLPTPAAPPFVEQDDGNGLTFRSSTN